MKKEIIDYDWFFELAKIEEVDSYELMMCLMAQTDAKMLVLELNFTERMKKIEEEIFRGD